MSATSALDYAALAPLLRVAWLHAMTPRRAYARASSTACAATRRRWPWRGALLVWALSIAALMAAWSGLMALLPASVALERAARVGCVLLAALASLLVSTLHDLGVAGLAGDALNDFTAPRRPVTARLALRAAQRALSLRALALHALLMLAIAGCLASAEAIARSSALATAPLAMLAAQQMLVFIATLLRAMWLAMALARSRGQVTAMALARSRSCDGARAQPTAMRIPSASRSRKYCSDTLKSRRSSIFSFG